ncbi:MAG: amino acid ABC transporter permease [Defluviitaleaceae bacterium]|nr:amino acid ABC transporter permease [Defluviitaleaceae bacterium]
MSEFFNNLWQNFLETDSGFEFYRAFIRDDRYQLFFSGMWVTIRLSAMALLFGTLIGLFITFLSLCKSNKHTVLPIKILIKTGNIFAGIYLDIIRGTPLIVQVMLWYFVIIGPLPINLQPLLVAGIAFGVNSGAYLSEIFRAGILSVDKGQAEAGRSLGMTRFTTMWRIVLPQAIKNVLPTIANEYIVLIKETAIAFVIGVPDIIRAAQVVNSRIFNPMMPFLGATVMYYIIIKFLSIIFKILEKRLRRVDTR